MRTLIQTVRPFALGLATLATVGGGLTTTTAQAQSEVAWGWVSASQASRSGTHTLSSGYRREVLPKLS